LAGLKLALQKGPFFYRNANRL